MALQTTCSGPTVDDIIAGSPQTTYTAAWASQTSSNLILDVRDVNITILVASDETLTNGVGEYINPLFWSPLDQGHMTACFDLPKSNL
jgi:hypothetical protein